MTTASSDGGPTLEKSRLATDAKVSGTLRPHISAGIGICPTTPSPLLNTSSRMRCTSNFGDVQWCSRDSHTPESREDNAVAIKGMKSGCRKYLAATTPRCRNWIKRRSNKPDGALGKHVRSSRNHASHSPHRRRSRAHRPTADSARNCRSGSHKPGWSCRLPLSLDRRDRTRPVCRDPEQTDGEGACGRGRGGGGARHRRRSRLLLPDVRRHARTPVALARPGRPEGHPGPSRPLFGRDSLNSSQVHPLRHASCLLAPPCHLVGRSPHWILRGFLHPSTLRGLPPDPHPFPARRRPEALPGICP